VAHPRDGGDGAPRSRREATEPEGGGREVATDAKKWHFLFILLNIFCHNISNQSFQIFVTIFVTNYIIPFF